MNKQKEFRKLFGRYKASDVDRYLLELGEETEKRMAGIENLRQAAEQESQLLRTQAEKERQERVALEEKLGQAAEKRRLEQMNAESLRKEIRTLEKQLAGVREEKQKCLSENRRLQAELGFAQLQSEQLGQRAASQRLEIERMEKMIEANPMADANMKAQKIVQEAVDSSQKMLDDAENIRTQATAAVRAAYFNAMGFRQVIEERFVNLQHELDKSMGSLRMLQSPGDYPVYVSGEKNE